MDYGRGFVAGVFDWVPNTYTVDVVPGYILEVQPHQTNELAEICPVESCTRIITGHSKGGATAEIAA